MVDKNRGDFYDPNKLSPWLWIPSFVNGPVVLPKVKNKNFILERQNSLNNENKIIKNYFNKQINKVLCT